ncbi:hypothetical protein OpiT1DRAFT_03905 [Opitutaceae bacterium TAV1]|nr:hypothetical protein OpiT1DRAFT_03905 [Opitutaceae bacterium TAV1]
MRSIHAASLCLSLVIAAPAISDTRADIAPTIPDARITIDLSPERSPGPVNPFILGHNIEAADNWRIFGASHTQSNDGQGFWNPTTRAPIPAVIDLANTARIGALRYPGGCLAHNFDWKKTIGPLAQRPNYQFGLEEWLSLCRALRAEPVFTVPDYAGTAQDAADLVEYLNAPATPAHPWAMKRAENGHPEPHHVKWFELGNETDHGNHQLQPKRRMTIDEYVSWAREYATAMRAADLGVKIGVNTVPGDGINAATSGWNQILYRDAAPFADFIVVHFYAPVVPRDASPARLREAAEGAMAVTEQWAWRLRQYRDSVIAATGMDLPIAITEYNIGAFQNTFRFSFAAGLLGADLIRLTLQPENGVFMANHWHFINGAWGMLRTHGNPAEAHTDTAAFTIEQRAAYPIYALLGQHLGTTLDHIIVDAPRATFNGTSGTVPALGDARQPSQILHPIDIPETIPSAPMSAPGKTWIIASAGPQSFTVDFKDHHGAAYPEVFHFRKPDSHPWINYRYSFDAYVETEPDSDRASLIPASQRTFGIGVADARGYAATRSATAVMGVEQYSSWHSFSGEFLTLPDHKKIAILARFEPVRRFTGRLHIRNLRIEAVTAETLPAYAQLTALATSTTSVDGQRTQHLVIINKNLDAPITANIALTGTSTTRSTSPVKYTRLSDDPAAQAPATPVTGSLAFEANHKLRHTFPPCSITAFTFTISN